MHERHHLQDFFSSFFCRVSITLDVSCVSEAFCNINLFYIFFVQFSCEGKKNNRCLETAT